MGSASGTPKLRFMSELMWPMSLPSMAKSSSVCFSTRMTLRPRSMSVRAQLMPAWPAPTTMNSASFSSTTWSAEGTAGGVRHSPETVAPPPMPGAPPWLLPGPPSAGGSPSAGASAAAESAGAALSSASAEAATLPSATTPPAAAAFLRNARREQFCAMVPPRFPCLVPYQHLVAIRLAQNTSQDALG